MASTINADDGVISGIAGVKTTADSTGALNIQTNGTTAITISAAQAVSLTNSPTFTGGTANGVLFLNASKVATSGTALVFDGTLLSTSTFRATSTTDSSLVSRLTNEDFQLYAANGVATSTSGSVKATIGLYFADTFANLNGGIQFTRGGAGTDGWMNFLTSGTERMRLDTSGNLGIGMTPNNILDITQNQNSSATSKILNNSAGAGARVDIIATNGTAQSQLTTFGTGFSTTSIFRANGTLVYATGAGGLTLSTDTAQPIYFATNQTERMRLDSSGNLGIQTAGASQTLGSAFQLGRVFSFAQDINSGYLGAGWFGTNSGTATYAVTGNYAVRQSFDSSAGAIKFFTAPTGTAGGTVTFTQAMTLDASGNLLVGTTSASNLGTKTKFSVNSGTGNASLGSLSANGTGAADTSISINQSDSGATILLLASRNTSAGLSTDSAVYIVRFYYNGNNAPTTTYVGGSSDFVTFGVSGSQTLTVTNAAGGNVAYAWFGNR